MSSFLHPSRVLGETPIKTGNTIADFGSGSGFYSVEAAGLVGASGKVIAFDVVPEACEATRVHARDRGVAGIVEVKRANLEKRNATGLPDASVDGVLVTNILFQTRSKEGIVSEAGRILKSGGWLLVVEWDKHSPLAPTRTNMPEEKEMEELVTQVAGAKVSRRFRPDQHHWAILFFKS